MLSLSEKVHLNNCKKIFRPLIPITLEEAQFIKNKWHHACLSALNILPTKENYNKNFNLDYLDIRNIIREYGVYPPKNHWYWNIKIDYDNNISL
jgi:hypothetical protein